LKKFDGIEKNGEVKKYEEVVQTEKAKVLHRSGFGTNKYSE
jgi:hypothetical protein